MEFRLIILLLTVFLFPTTYSRTRDPNFWSYMKPRLRDSIDTHIPQPSFSDVFSGGVKQPDIWTPEFIDQVDNVQGGISAVIDQSVHDPMVVVGLPRGNPQQMPPPPRFHFPRMPTIGQHFPQFEHNFPQFPIFSGNPFHMPRNEWWKGQNVCVQREEIDEGNHTDSRIHFAFHSTNCWESDHAHKCSTRFHAGGINKIFTVIYSCCHGYQRLSPTGYCEKVDLESLLDTIKKSGGSIFAELISFSGLTDKFQNENLTVFCPTDLALKDYHENFEENVIVMTPTVHRKRRAVSNDHLVLAHVVPGLLKTSDIMDEKILLTENPSAGIRTNVYNLPHRIITANCAKVLSSNNFATNGIVHMVNNVLPPLTQRLGEIIFSDSRFSIFKSLLEKTHGLLEALTQDGQFTVLAPTDDAFNKVNPELLEKLKRGEGCVSSIMKYHILPNVVCQEILPKRSRSITMLGTDVKFHKPVDDRLLVNDVNVLINDQEMATNGVLYPIEDMLIPSQSKPLTAVLDEWHLSDLVDLLEKAKLKDKMDSMKNYTYLAPTNEAVQAARPFLNELLRHSPEKFNELMMFHVGYPITLLCTADNNHEMTSGVSDKKIRFNHFTSMFGLSHQVTAQCARIIQMDGQACEGSVQMVERVLMPPEGHLGDVISSNQSFSIFKRILQNADFESEIANHGPYTVLAPTDTAFYTLPEQHLADLLQNKEAADEVVRNHILPEVLCCAGIPPTTHMFHENARALSGALHQLNRYHGGLFVGSARVEVCDMMADNGVVHSINKVLLPEQRQVHYRRPFVYPEY